MHIASAARVANRFRLSSETLNVISLVSISTQITSVTSQNEETVCYEGLCYYKTTSGLLHNVMNVWMETDETMSARLANFRVSK